MAKKNTTTANVPNKKNWGEIVVCASLSARFRAVSFSFALRFLYFNILEWTFACVTISCVFVLFWQTMEKWAHGLRYSLDTTVKLLKVIPFSDSFLVPKHIISTGLESLFSLKTINSVKWCVQSVLIKWRQIILLMLQKPRDGICQI